MEAMRETWSDDRLDDLNRRVDTGFVRLHADLVAQREKIETVDTGLRNEIKAVDARLQEKIDTNVKDVRGEIKALGESLNARFDALQRVLIVALLGGLFTIVAQRLF